jgi:hypothetical protein
MVREALGMCTSYVSQPHPQQQPQHHKNNHNHKHIIETVCFGFCFASDCAGAFAVLHPSLLILLVLSLFAFSLLLLCDLYFGFAVDFALFWLVLFVELLLFFCFRICV